jgi:tetratricopeptide (TPR) repeat protein
LAAMGTAAWGQAPAPAEPQADRASAYYHYTLAHMYAELAGSPGGNTSANISKAIDNYKQAIKADPTSSLLSEELTEFYVQSGRLSEAQSDAEETLKKDPNDVNSLRLLGRIYAGQITTPRNNRVDEEMLRRTIAQYTKITTLVPKDVDSWLMLGRLYKIKEDSAESEKAYKKALDLDPDNEDALSGLALVYSDLGDAQKAADVLRSLADKSPSERSLRALAAAYEELKQFGLAADALNRALSLNPPDSADVKRFLAEDLVRAERFDEAIKIFEDFIAENPKDAGSYLRISEIYRAQRNFAKARENFDKAKSLDPESVEIRYDEVLLFAAEGKTVDAIQALKEILSITAKTKYTAGESQNRVRLLNQLAALYSEADQTELAVETYRQTSELDSSLGPVASAYIVEAYRQAHLFPKAEQEATAGLKKFPDSRELHVEHAYLQADLGKSDQAASEIKKLMDGKNDLETYMTLARVYDKARKFDDMGKTLDTAEKLSQGDEQKKEVWFTRGAMYERMKRIDLAEVEFRKVLKVDPDYALAFNYIGYMLADRNTRLQESLELINKALEKDPGNGAYLDSLGWVYFRLGRLPEAEENLRRAVEKTPRDPTVHDHMAQVLMGESKVREAIAQWQLSLKEWDAGAPADLEPAEVAKVKSRLEEARVRLAKETTPGQRQ